MKKFLLALALPVLLAACNKMEDVLMYDDISFGEVVSGKIVTDAGNTYNVVESKLSDDSWKNAGRYIFDCDILTKVSDGNYNVRLHDFAPVKVVNALKSSEISAEARGNDGVLASQVWMSGPGANILVQYTAVKNSNMFHDINLVLDEERSKDKHLYFVLTHNGNGETFDNEEVSLDNLGIYSKYYTFDIRELVKGLSGSYTLTFEYDWFISSGQELLREKETSTVSGVVSF